jgi:hypothetical protein
MEIRNRFVDIIASAVSKIENYSKSLSFAIHFCIQSQVGTGTFGVGCMAKVFGGHREPL